MALRQTANHAGEGDAALSGLDRVQVALAKVHRVEVVRVESQSHAFEVEHRADEKYRSGEQDRGERDLSNDQRPAQPAVTERGARRTGSQRLSQMPVRNVQRAEHADYQADGDRQTRGE